MIARPPPARSVSTGWQMQSFVTTNGPVVMPERASNSNELWARAGQAKLKTIAANASRAQVRIVDCIPLRIVCPQLVGVNFADYGSPSRGTTEVLAPN